MSEAAADLLHFSEHKHPETQDLAGLINSCFERVVAEAPPELYTKMAAGQTEQLCIVPGLGQIALQYHGSRYVPSNPELERDTETPSQRFEYTLRMVEDDTNQLPGEPGPLGWWMRIHMAYGPKLVIDTPVTIDELPGSTLEERQRLERLIESLQAAYVHEIKPEAAS